MILNFFLDTSFILQVFIGHFWSKYLTNVHMSIFLKSSSYLFSKLFLLYIFHSNNSIFTMEPGIVFVFYFILFVISLLNSVESLCWLHATVLLLSLERP